MPEDTDDHDHADRPGDSGRSGDPPEARGRPPGRYSVKGSAILPGARAKLKKRALQMLATGEHTAVTVAKALGINRKTVYKFVQEEGLQLAPGVGENKGLGQRPDAPPPKAPRMTQAQRDAMHRAGASKPPRRDPLDPDVLAAAAAATPRDPKPEKSPPKPKKTPGQRSTPPKDLDRLPTDPDADRLGALKVPDNFDPLVRLTQFAIAHWLPEAVQLSALRELARMRHEAEKGRGRIDWDKVSIAQIPEEHRHRLAGELMSWVQFAELPEAVRLAPREARRVYRLIGRLPETPAATEAILRRWLEQRAELRGMVGGALVVAPEPREPVQPTLAAETRYQPPRWGALAVAEPHGGEDDLLLS